MIGGCWLRRSAFRLTEILRGAAVNAKSIQLNHNLYSALQPLVTGSCLSAHPQMQYSSIEHFNREASTSAGWDADGANVLLLYERLMFRN